LNNSILIQQWPTATLESAFSAPRWTLRPGSKRRNSTRNGWRKSGQGVVKNKRCLMQRAAPYGARKHKEGGIKLTGTKVSRTKKPGELLSAGLYSNPIAAPCVEKNQNLKCTTPTTQSLWPLNGCASHATEKRGGKINNPMSYAYSRLSFELRWLTLTAAERTAKLAQREAIVAERNRIFQVERGIELRCERRDTLTSPRWEQACPTGEESFRCPACNCLSRGGRHCFPCRAERDMP